MQHELTKLHPMSLVPPNMTRILVSYKETFEFAFFKERMLKPDSSKNWYPIENFDGWLPIEDLKKLLC